MIGEGGIKGAAECARAFLRGEHIIGDVRVRLHCRWRGFGEPVLAGLHHRQVPGNQHGSKRCQNDDGDDGEKIPRGQGPEHGTPYQDFRAAEKPRAGIKSALPPKADIIGGGD